MHRKKNIHVEGIQEVVERQEGSRKVVGKEVEWKYEYNQLKRIIIPEKLLQGFWSAKVVIKVQVVMQVEVRSAQVTANAMLSMLKVYQTMQPREEFMNLS